jgi:hypothetical protein
MALCGQMPGLSNIQSATLNRSVWIIVFAFMPDYSFAATDATASPNTIFLFQAEDSSHEPGGVV